MTADELRAALRELGYTQRRLAHLMGVDNATVNRWCQGTLKVPRYVEAYIELERETARLLENRAVS
jgi:transcriptional regulator with XRE-family HTH domain